MRIFTIILAMLFATASYGQIEKSILNIGDFTSWVRNDALFSWEELGWNGEFPKGSKVGVVFSEGIVYGGKVYDGLQPVLRVNGSTYISGYKPAGKIWRVRRDWETADLKWDAATFFQKDTSEVKPEDIQFLREKYRYDWENWPWKLGAPFEDKDGDGIYNPEIDIPGVPNATQTIWFRVSDLNSYDFAQCPPVGMEIQFTIWGYSKGSLEEKLKMAKNIIFKRIKIIYKGLPQTPENARIDSFYIVLWSDVNVGNYSDDYAGSDTTLGLIYAYNSTNIDVEYQKAGIYLSPGVGYDAVTGVYERSGNENDSAIVDFKWKKGYRYVYKRPYQAMLIDRSGDMFITPALASYEGAKQWFTLMKGYLPTTGLPIVDPTTGKPTKFMLSGDPVNKTGWYDGLDVGPGAREIYLVHGPFTVHLGDTLEFTYATFGALGADNMHTVTILKLIDMLAQFLYDYSTDPPTEISNATEVPQKYELYQNYPNPFNFETFIKFSLPEESEIKLSVYDLLGRKVKVISSGLFKAGTYVVSFDASNLPSGVYFYKLEAEAIESKRRFIKSRKMVLVK